MENAQVKGTNVKHEDNLDPEEFILRKRLPRKFPKRPNDVYVTKKTFFSMQLARCRKLLESGKYNAIFIHGLGNAVDRAVNIALQLQVASGLSEGGGPAVIVSANTSTVDLIDDLIPLDDYHEGGTQSRRASAVHIKLSKAASNSSVSSDTSSAKQQMQQHVELGNSKGQKKHKIHEKS